MSGPNLALGISAPGVSQVVALADAVERLDRGLRGLGAGGAGANGLAGLAGLEAQMRKLRAELKVGTQGLRTDLAELKSGIAKAFTDSFNGMAQAATAGAAKAAAAVDQAEKTTRSSVDRYTASMMVGSAKYEQTRQAQIAKESAADQKYLYRMMVGSAQYEQARQAAAAKEGSAAMSFRAKMMVGAQKIAESLEQAAAKEESARLGYRIKMMAGSAKIAEAAQAAAAKEDSARLGYRIKMMAGSLKLAEDAQAAAAKEDGAKLSYRIKMMAGSAKIAESLEQAAQREEQGRLNFRIKMMAGSFKIAEAADKAARREEESKLAYRIKMMVGSQQIAEAAEAAARKVAEAKAKEAAAIELATRTAEAAYQRANARTQARIAVSAASQLDQGISPALVQQRFGASALGVASGNSTASLQEEYRRLKTATDEFGNAKEKATPKLKAFTNQMNDAHSAARGLASGFGAMWLTWGNLLPLLAGAALSHGFVQTVKMGAEVQNTFTQIRVLAGESYESVAQLNTQMLELARSSQYGPGEVAKAMKTLSLAGLDAKAVFSSVRDVLNFAVSGDTSIEKASDVMTTVATAFNVTADKYSYVGDSIAKAAAESKSSVEGMGEAFKTASVIHQQYGVTLEDTSVGLALLANAGIQNTAAGTAMRNMYADLAGRTPKVEKAMRELGVNAIDPTTGKLRDLTSIFRDLTESLSKYTPTDQFKFIQDIFSERGGKEAIAVMNAMRQEAQALGGDVGSAFDVLREKVLDSAGFTVKAAAEMSLTPLNQMKSVMSSLQATLVETFDSLQPYIIDLALHLKELFASQEFRDNLRELLKLVADGVTFFIEHARAIAATVAAYTALKAVVGVLTTVAAGITAVRTAATVGAGGLAALGVAGAALAPILATIVGVVTAAAAGWAAYKLATGESLEKTEEFAGSNHVTALLKRLEEEETRIDRINEARARGITLMELEASLQVETVRSQEPPELVAKRKELALLETNKQTYDKNRKRLPWEKDAPSDQAATQLKREIVKLEEQHAANLVKVENALDRIKAKQKAVYDDERNVKGIDAARSPRGPLTRSQTSPFARTPFDNSMQISTQGMNDELSVLKNHFDNRGRVLQDAYRAEEMTAGAYFARMIALQEEHEQAEAAAIDKGTKEFDKAYAEQYSKILAAGLEPGPLKQALDNLAGQYEAFGEKVAKRILELRDDSAAKLAEVTLLYQRETNKLVQANDQYWLKADASMQKDLAASQAKRDLANATDEVRVVAEAHAKVEGQHAVQVENLTVKLLEAKRALADFRATYDDRDLGGATAGTAAALQNRVTILTAELNQAGDSVNRLKELAGNDALNDLQNKKADTARREIEKMSKDVAGSLADAILDGGKDGFDELEDYAKDIFKKPIRMVLQAAFQPIGNMVGNFVGQMMGVGQQSSMGGGGFNIGGMAQQFMGSDSFNGVTDKVAGWFGGGSGIGGAAISGAEISATTDATSYYLSQAGATAAEAGAASGALGSSMSSGAGAGAASAIGSALPYVGALYQASQGNYGSAAGMAIGTMIMPGIGTVVGALIGGMLDGGGETRSGATYRNGQFAHGPSGGQIEGAQGLTTDAMSSINAAIKNMGGTTELTDFLSAVETSKKGKGFVYAGGTLSNGAAFGERNELEGRMNRRGSKTPEQAMAEYTEELRQAFLEAIQFSDAKGELANWIRSQGDMGSKTGSEVTAIYERVEKALKEKATLEQRLVEMTTTEVQKLAKAREAELAAIDPTNAALLRQVHAQEDYNKAASELVSVYNEQVAALSGYAKELRDWLEEVMVGDASPLSTFEKLAQAESQFASTLAKARGGDADARGALTGKASTLLENLLNTAGSRVEYAMGFSRVTSAVSGEATAAESEIEVMKQQLETQRAQLEALGLLNDNVKTFAQAWATFNSAKTNLEAAKTATQAAANQAAVVMPAPKVLTWEEQFVAAYGSPLSDDDVALARRVYGSQYDAKTAATLAQYGIFNQQQYGQAGGDSFATGGYHWGGLRLVGENGPEIEATGAAYIHDAATTRKILSGDGSGRDDSALIQEIQMLRYETRATATHTQQLSKDFRELKLRGFPVTNNEDGEGVLKTEAA